MASRDYYEGIDQPIFITEWCAGLFILGFVGLVFFSPIILAALFISAM